MDKLEISPDECIDIRIFLKEDAILEKVTIQLESEGMVITDIEEGPDVMVKGSIAVKNLTEIEAVPEVDRIEYDRDL